MIARFWLLMALVGLTTSPVVGQFVSGSDGSDGAFNPLADVEVDLSLAGGGSGTGTYDPALWAVIFNYTTVDIPAGVTVTFRNHPKGAPVVWLATGDATIAGTVDVEGETGASTSQLPMYAQPGPGGFAGGSREINTTLVVPASAGFGPGGAPAGTEPTLIGKGGGYGSVGGQDGGDAYGSQFILPLIGGSGGSARKGVGGGGGGAGGGALLIASSGEIVLIAGGTITAKGGVGGINFAGGGSGGAIRLLANTISGDGTLRANGGTQGPGGGLGGAGRIRLDADVITLVDIGNPQWTAGFNMNVFPDVSTAPTLKATFVDGSAVPTDPDATIRTRDVEIANDQPVTINIEATNIPVGTTVDVIVMRAREDRFTVTSTPLADAGGGLLTATAVVTFDPGRDEIQLKANWTP